MSILPQNIGDPIADAQRDAERLAAIVAAQRQASSAVNLAAAQQQLGEMLKVILGDTLINEMGRGYAEHTLKAYAVDFKRFKKWCGENDPPLPCLPAAPETVASFLVEMSGEIPPLPSVIRMHSAIGHHHQVRELFNPTSDFLVQATMKWLRERFAEAKANGHTEKGNGHSEKGNGSGLTKASDSRKGQLMPKQTTPTRDMSAKLERFEKNTREGRGGRFTGTRPTDEMTEGNVDREGDGVRHVPIDLIDKHSRLVRAVAAHRLCKERPVANDKVELERARLLATIRRTRAELEELLAHKVAREAERRPTVPAGVHRNVMTRGETCICAIMTRLLQVDPADIEPSLLKQQGGG